MEEQKILIEFASSENDFIYNDGVNKGHTLTYLKVNRCPLMSAEARTLYNNIRGYAYNGRDCFPGQNRLRAELGWGAERFSKYLDELRDEGLITTIHRPNRTLIYRINELHKVKVLAHSEVIYAILEGIEVEDLYTTWQRYKKSELCKEVRESEDPTQYRDKLLDWFIKDNFEKAQKKAENSIESKPKVEEKPQEKKVSPLGVKVIPNMDVERTDEDPTKSTPKKPKKKGSKEWFQKNITDWNKNDFYSFFTYEYKRATGHNYVAGQADRKALFILIDKRKDEKEVIKKHIENFLSLEHFDVKTARAFSSNYSQNVLDNYLNSGKLPSYKNNEGKKQSYQVDDDWKDGLDDLFKR